MPSRPQHSPDSAAPLPADLEADIRRAGYFPDIVLDMLALTLDGETVLAHLVHQDTSFDTTEELRRHLGVLVLTESRILVAYSGDHAPEHPNPSVSAVTASSVEAVGLSDIRSVVLKTVVAQPHAYRRGQMPDDVSIIMSWGTVRHVDMEPATCGDPECPADHGFTGTSTADDVMVRVSTVAEGPQIVRRALHFVQAANQAIRNRR